MNINLHRNTYNFYLSIIFISMGSITMAQEMKDEFKRKLRESPFNSEMQPSQHIHQPTLRRFHLRDEILRVSPTTKLPTRLDRILKIGKVKVKEIQIDLNATKVQPMNIRPYGSVKYEFDGKQMHIRSNAGEVVNPSEQDFDPVRAIQRHKARKRQRKVDEIIRIYGLE